MKAKTIFDFLLHFSTEDLNDMEIQVVCEMEKKLSVQKLSVECTEGHAIAFNEKPQNHKLLIIVG